MTHLRHLPLATSLVLIAVSGSAAAPGNSGKTVGEMEFVYGETVKNDTLWAISSDVMPDDVSINHKRVMAAILRRNPDAFFNGNAFYLRQGVVLTIPGLKEIRAEDLLKADALLADHEQAWKDARKAPGKALPGAPRAETPAPGQEAENKERAVAPPAPVPVKPVEPPPAAVPATGVPAVPAAASVAPAAVPVAPPEAQSGGGYLAYGAGLAAVLGALTFLLRGRRKGVAANRPAAGSASVPTGAAVAYSMAGIETLRALENLEITRQVVACGNPEPPTPDPAAAGDDAQMKLKIAKAYLELSRDSAACALLEEVAAGGGAPGSEAGMLLARWRNTPVAQDAAEAG
ncbi:MAG: hypothetical protein HY777_01150 [Betaproteobacteria bacterium]|nr:hypothetical protein [Betaproteobacteria bacterium]